MVIAAAAGGVGGGGGALPGSLEGGGVDAGEGFEGEKWRGVGVELELRRFWRKRDLKKGWVRARSKHLSQNSEELHGRVPLGSASSRFQRSDGIGIGIGIGIGSEEEGGAKQVARMTLIRKYACIGYAQDTVARGRNWPRCKSRLTNTRGDDSS